MADDNKDKRAQNEKEITSQMGQQNRYAQEQSRYSQEASAAAASRVEFARSLTEELKDQMNIRTRLNETEKATLSLARQLQSSAAQNNVELGNSQMIGRQIQKDEKLLAQIQTEKYIALKSLREDDINLAKKIAEGEMERASLADKIAKDYERLDNLTGDAAEKLFEQIESSEKTLANIEKTNDSLLKQAAATGRLSKADIDRVAVLDLMLQNQTKNIKLKKQEEEIQKAINDKMGVTGALVEGVGGIMQRLGMRSGIFNDAMEEAKETMFEMAEQSTRVIEYTDENNELVRETAKSYGKISIMLAGAGKLAKGFGKALLDPLTIILKIADAFFKVDKAATDLQQLTGQNSAALAGFNSRLASSVDVLETMAELTKQTGMNAQNIFSPDVLAGAAELKNTLGLAADEAGGLAMIAQTTGGDIDATTEAIVDQTSAFNKANRSAVSQGQVLRDVAKTSDGIKASFAGMPGALANAAASARRLGMDLSRLDAIAGSLMDFESSIEAELEAQLLTGKNINMAKARELALNNDLAGLSKELFKNSSSIAEFGKMNRIQQEAQAKALGMTRDELGKIAYQRALETGMTKEQAAAAAGVKKEDMERMAVQDKLAKAADKLAQAFAPMLDILIPIADLIGFIAKVITYPVSAVMKLADSIKGAEENTSSFRNILAGIVKLLAGGAILGGVNAIKNLLTGKGLKFDLFDKIKGKITGVADTAKEKGKEMAESLAEKGKDKVKDVAAKGKDKVEDLASKAGDKTSKVAQAEPKTSGQGIKEFLTNLAEGLKAMGSTKVLGGALNLIPASIGFIAFIPGMVGVKLAEQIKGDKLKEGLTGLADGLTAFGNTSVTGGALNLIAASAGFIAFIPGMIGVKLIEYINGEKVKVGLEGIAQGLQSMASLKTLAGAGVLVLSAVGFVTMLPAIPAMLALSFAAPLAAAGLAALGPALGAFGVAAAPAIPILLTFAGVAVGVGLALRLAAPAFEAFGTVIEKAFGGIATVITAAADGLTNILGAITPGSVLSLALLGPALISAGAGLATFSFAALMALPGLGVLGMLAAMADPLATVGTSLTTIAAGIAAISAALSTLETEKLDEIKDLVITTAFAAPMVAATGAITSMIQGISGGGEQSKSDPAMIEKLDAILAAIKEGGDVYIDGNKAGESLMLAAVKSS